MARNLAGLTSVYCRGYGEDQRPSKLFGAHLRRIEDRSLSKITSDMVGTLRIPCSQFLS